MKWFLLALAVTLPLALGSCSITATAVPASGPLKNQGVTTLNAKFTYAGTGHGKVEITMPWGEVCKGTYSTVVGGTPHPGFDTESRSGAVAIATSNNVGLYGIQTGRALLVGSQGTTMDVEYTTSGANPRHGHGSAKDSKGNIYRIIW